MHCAQKMTHNIYWIGSNDWTTERFENLFPIPNGVSYNSYFIDDEKTCVVDSVDAEIREEYFDNLTHLLNGRDLDYIIVNHMEPDHCQTLLETLERYPNCKMVGNATTFRMFEQFYNTPKPDQYSFGTVRPTDSKRYPAGRHWAGPACPQPEESG